MVGVACRRRVRFSGLPSVEMSAWGWVQVGYGKESRFPVIWTSEQLGSLEPTPLIERQVPNGILMTSEFRDREKQGKLSAWLSRS